MVIFDTKNNNFDNPTGILYLSIMDAEYLMSKYGIKHLETLIPPDYVEYFKCALEERINDDIFSENYYSILAIKIETKEDQELLKLIKQERHILFTKSDLAHMNIPDIESVLEEISFLKNLSLEELYLIRTYKMVLYVNNKLIELSNCIENNDKEKYQEIEKILLNIGLCKYIKETAYLKKQKKVV